MKSSGELGDSWGRDRLNMLLDAALMFSEATLDLDQLLGVVTRAFVAGVASECSVELLAAGAAALNESAERSERRIVIPLPCRGQVVARATLTRSAGDARYTEDDQHWAARLARHAGLAIGNARAYAAGLAPAESSQRSKAALEVDGTEFPIEVSRSPRQTESGLLVSSAIRDISERKKSEQQRASLAALVESSDDAIIGKSLEGIVTSWNEGAHRLFGYSSAEIIGQPISLIVPAERTQEFEAVLRAPRPFARQCRKVHCLRTRRWQATAERHDVPIEQPAARRTVRPRRRRWQCSATSRHARRTKEHGVL
jgi:PAS domain-containing protein